MPNEEWETQEKGNQKDFEYGLYTEIPSARM